MKDVTSYEEYLTQVPHEVQEEFEKIRKGELCEWLVLLADSNAPEVIELAENDEEKQFVLEELERLSQDKEALMSMLSDKYEEINRYSEYKQAQEMGHAAGHAAGHAEGHAAGHAEGHAIGQVASYVDLIQKNLCENRDAESIASFLKVDIEYVKNIATLLALYPEENEEEIAKRILKIT